jgi:outer membrane murein-binding lipoprotein Lpp
MPNSSLDPRQPRVRTALWIIGSVGATALVIGAIFLTTSIYQLSTAVRDTQVANVERAEQDRQRAEQTAATAEAAARAAARIEDCTTPGRQCFEDQVKRTGDAVAGINQGTLAVIVAALSCQEDGITDQRPLARCTANRAAAASTVKDQPQAQEKRR